MFQKHRFRTVHKVTLQFVLIFQMFVPHPFLTFPAAFPMSLGAFVSPDMEILTGKKRGNLINHIFQKVEDTVVSRTIYVVFHSPLVAKPERSLYTG